MHEQSRRQEGDFREARNGQLAAVACGEGCENGGLYRKEGGKAASVKEETD